MLFYFSFYFYFIFCSSGVAVLGSSSRLAPPSHTCPYHSLPVELDGRLLAACLISLVFGSDIELENVAILGPVDESTLVLLLVSLGAVGLVA